MKANANPASDLVALLESRRGWVKAKRLSAFANDRKLRALANSSGGKIITGQRGYKAACHATPEEIAHSANWLEHQGREMLRRAQGIRKAVVQANRGKKNQISQAI